MSSQESEMVQVPAPRGVKVLNYVVPYWVVAVVVIILLYIAYENNILGLRRITLGVPPATEVSSVATPTVVQDIIRG
jgi:hypothetical protein